VTDAVTVNVTSPLQLSGSSGQWLGLNLDLAPPYSSISGQKRKSLPICDNRPRLTSSEWFPISSSSARRNCRSALAMRNRPRVTIFSYRQ
jgi:hypothetical protein